MSLTRHLRYLVALLLLATLGACGGGGGESGSTSGVPPATPPAGQRLSFSFASAETQLTYTVQVFLPAGYEQGQTRYPVVYATDAEYRFDVLSGVLESTRRPAILVNVGNMGNDRRWVDYTWPGAGAYYRFLTRELIPRVDAQYRTDPANRALTGHSLSGEFVMFALYLERPESRYFNAFIPQDGSFWYGPDQRLIPDPPGYDLARQLEAEMRGRSMELPVTLAMSGDNPGNYPRVKQLHDDIAGVGYSKLRIQVRQYSLGHIPMDGPAFKDALDFIYGP